MPKDCRLDEMKSVDLIVPIWSSARSAHRPEFGSMEKTEEDGLLAAIATVTCVAAPATRCSTTRSRSKRTSTSTRRHLPPLSRAGSSQRAKLVCDDVDMVAEGNGSLAVSVA